MSCPVFDFPVFLRTLLEMSVRISYTVPKDYSWSPSHEIHSAAKKSMSTALQMAFMRSQNVADTVVVFSMGNKCADGSAVFKLFSSIGCVGGSG